MEEVFSLKDGGYDFAPFEYEDDEEFSVTTSTSKQQTYGTQTYRKMYIHSSSISPKVRKRNFGECLNNRGLAIVPLNHKIMETTKMCLLELTKAEAMVLANVIRRTANENPFHWKESSVEKTRDLYDSVIAQLYDYKY